jgi:hypothetical protein
MLTELTLPVPLDTRIGRVMLRRARPDDTAAIVSLLADDEISAARGDTASDDDLPAYAAGLESVLADGSNDLLVAEHDGAVVATFQLTRIPGMSRQGSTRLLVEAVRVSSRLRSSGVGSALMRWSWTWRPPSSAVRSCSSPPTRSGSTRTGSTSGSASPDPISASSIARPSAAERPVVGS